MKKREHVSAIMTKDVVTVDITDTLHDVNHIFATKPIRHLPTTSGDELVGIISQMMKHSFRLGHGQIIREAAETFVNHALPVVEEGRGIGIITTTDIIRFFRTIEKGTKKVSQKECPLD